MKPISRRQVLGSVGLAAGAGLWTGFGRELHSAPQAEHEPARAWNYTHLDPETVAAEAYRLFADGACMYGLFGAVVTGLASQLGEPFRSFPLHMMRYGKGGVGGWGSLCGTLNGGAAVIGLVEPDKERQAKLVAELFSWYETTPLPSYQPKQHDDSPAVPKSVKNTRTGRIVDVRPTPAVMDLLAAFKPQAKAGTGHGPESKADDEHLAAVARKIAAMLDKDVASVRWWRGGESGFK